MAKEMSRGGYLILLLVFLALGLGMLVGFTWVFDTGMAPRSWDRVDCRIESSEVVTTDDGYRFDVEYGYRYGGRRYTSNTVTPWYSGQADYAHGQAYLAAYPEGSVALCLVNPEAPEEAALGWTMEWHILPLLLLPLVFLIFGGLGLRQWVLEGRGRQGEFYWGGFWPGVIVFGSIFAVGILYFVFLFLLPSAEMLSSLFWREVPCTVVSSRVMPRPSGDDNLPALAPDVLFEYAWDGQRYRSNRFDVMEMPSSDREEVQAIVDQYPAGQDTSCYLDPDRPGEAVLTRTFYPGVLLHALFALPFILFPVWGIRKYLREV